MSGLDAAVALHGEWATCDFLRSLHRSNVGPLPREAPLRSSECVVVDVGSHIGMCSLAFAVMGCKVVAIDILRQHTEMIAESALVNPSDSVTVFLFPC